MIIKNKPPRKWLNRPLVDVSSMTILACIFSSTWPTIGSTHPFWHAGVFPDPEGAVAIRCRFAFSSYEPKSLSVVCPSKELVETRAEQSNISFVIPLHYGPNNPTGPDVPIGPNDPNGSTNANGPNDLNEPNDLNDPNDPAGPNTQLAQMIQLAQMTQLAQLAQLIGPTSLKQ